MTNQAVHSALFDQYHYTWADKNLSPSGRGLGIVATSTENFAHIEDICRNVYNSVRKDGVPSRQLFFSKKNNTFVVANVSEAVNTQSPRPCEMYHLYEFRTNGRPIADCPPEEYLCPDTFTNSYYGENQKLSPIEFGFTLPSARELASKYGLDNPERLAVFLDKLYKAVLERRTGFVIVHGGVATERLSDYSCEMAVIIHSLIPPSAKPRATFISNSSGQSIPSFAFNFCNRSLAKSDFMYDAMEETLLHDDSIQHSMAIFMAKTWLTNPDLFRACNAELDRLINIKKISREEYSRVPFVFFGMHSEITLSARAAYKSFKEMLNFYKTDPEYDSLQAQESFVRLAELIDDIKALKELAGVCEKNLDSTYKKTRFFELLAQIATRDTQSAGEILENLQDRTIPVEAYFYFTNTNRQDIFPISNPPLQGIENPMQLRELYTNPSYYQDPIAYGESAAELSWLDPNFNNKTNYYAFAKENGMAEIFESHSRQLAIEALTNQSMGVGLRAIKNIALKMPVAFAESDVFNELWTEAAGRTKSQQDMAALSEIADYLGKQTDYRKMAIESLDEFLRQIPTMKDLSEFILAHRLEGDEMAKELCEKYIRDSDDESDLSEALRVIGLFPNDGKLFNELQSKMRADDKSSKALSPSRIYELAQIGPMNTNLAQMAFNQIQINSSRFFEEFFHGERTPDIQKVQVFLDRFGEAASNDSEDNELHKSILKEMFAYMVSDHDKRLASTQLVVSSQLEKDAFLTVLKANPKDDECRMLLLNLANREYEKSNRTPAWKSFQRYCTLTRNADIVRLRDFAIGGGLRIIPKKLGEIPKGTVNTEFLEMAFLAYFLSPTNEDATVFKKLYEASSEDAQEEALRFAIENIVASPVAATIVSGKKEYLARDFLDGQIPLIADVFSQVIRKGIVSPETYLASLDQKLYSDYLVYKNKPSERAHTSPLNESAKVKRLDLEDDDIFERGSKDGKHDTASHKRASFSDTDSFFTNNSKEEERAATDFRPNGYNDVEEDDDFGENFDEYSEGPWFRKNVLSFMPAFLSAIVYKFLTAYLSTQTFFTVMLGITFVAFILMVFALRSQSKSESTASDKQLKNSAMALLCVLFLVCMYGIDFFIKISRN